MKRTYRTAQGKMIDLDSIILTNEQTIAVGNMNVNARGDELGPGGQVVARRNQNMNDYYRLNTNSTGRNKTQVEAPAPIPVRQQQMMESAQPDEVDNTAEPAPQPPAPTKRQGLRGNLADAVAKRTVVEQPEINTIPEKKGPTRI